MLPHVEAIIICSQNNYIVQLATEVRKPYFFLLTMRKARTAQYYSLIIIHWDVLFNDLFLLRLRSVTHLFFIILQSIKRYNEIIVLCISNINQILLKNFQ